MSGELGTACVNRFENGAKKNPAIKADNEAATAFRDLSTFWNLLVGKVMKFSTTVYVLAFVSDIMAYKSSDQERRKYYRLSYYTAKKLFHEADGLLVTKSLKAASKSLRAGINSSLGLLFRLGRRREDRRVFGRPEEARAAKEDSRNPTAASILSSQGRCQAFAP